MRIVIVFILALLLLVPFAYAATIVSPQIRPTSVDIGIISPIALTLLCNEGDIRCDDNIAQRCKSSKWVSVEKCSSNEKCIDEKGCVSLGKLALVTPTAPFVKPVAVKITPTIKLAQRTRLGCPKVQKHFIKFPKPPYGKNDCELVGKSKEIEVYLQALENIAVKCKAGRAAAWQAVLDARANLDDQIDELVEPEVEDDAVVILILPEGCPSYSEPEPSESGVDIELDESVKYTNWLRGISENVKKYCGLIDELMKPIWRACDQINFYLDCEPPNKDVYHSILNSRMNGAKLRYEHTDFYYTDTLQYGWDSFREYFNEDSIKCPSKGIVLPKEVSIPGKISEQAIVGFNPQPEPPARTGWIVRNPRPQPNFLQRFFSWLFG